LERRKDTGVQEQKAVRRGALQAQTQRGDGDEGDGSERGAEPGTGQRKISVYDEYLSELPHRQSDALRGAVGGDRRGEESVYGTEVRNPSGAGACGHP